jgi:Ion channel
MLILAAIFGFLVIFFVLLDAFETIVLPRKVQRAFRITSWFYRRTWVPWTKLAGLIRVNSFRENFLGYFGPLSLIVLLGVWATGLIFGFALMQYGLGEHVRLSGEAITFGVLLYHSGETFFTLGYGDITPVSPTARLLAVIESGMGFAFLGLVVGYLPVIYSSFSSRETEISLLDARAGSPPTAGELLVRLGCCPDQTVLDNIFRGWERWSADLLSSHISYPVLCFFRSQHSNQSWLAALTTMLDVTALVLAGIDGIRPDQAKLTFAMARHAAVDLTQVVNARYQVDIPDRLPPERLEELRKLLQAAGMRVRNDEYADQKLLKLRSMYEPYCEDPYRDAQGQLAKWSLGPPHPGQRIGRGDTRDR